jgi:putative colanic acid biosynthesis acetyltransferase WcaF
MKLLGHASPSPWSRQVKLKRLLWVLTCQVLFRWSPPSWFAWRNTLLRWFGAKILDSAAAPARVWPDVQIYFPWLLQMGSACIAGPGTRIYNLAQVTLEDGANLSRHVHVCAGSHDFERWEMPLTTAPIMIGRNSWVATDCYIGPGVSIGEECVIGARSVVVSDQPARMICVGHPCKPVKPRPPIR